MKSRILSTVLLVAVAGPVSASVTYQYIGNEFTSRRGGGPLFPELGSRITASIVFDDAVDAHFTGDGEPHVLMATVATELLSLATSVSRFSYFGIELVNGEMKHWAVFGAERLGSIELGTQNFNNGINHFEGDISIVEGTERANIVTTPGTWSRIASPVPIPASLFLIGSTLGALCLGRRQIA